MTPRNTNTPIRTPFDKPESLPWTSHVPNSLNLPVASPSNNKLPTSRRNAICIDIDAGSGYILEGSGCT